MTPIKIFLRFEQGTTKWLLRARLLRLPSDEWRAHLRQSWRKRRYWGTLHRGPAPRTFRLQLLDWVIEARVMEPRDGKLQD